MSAVASFESNEAIFVDIESESRETNQFADNSKIDCCDTTKRSGRAFYGK